MPRLLPALLVSAAVLFATACTSAPAQRQATPAEDPAPAGLRVEQVAAGFDHPWDIGFLPGGELLVTERPGRLTLLSGGEPGARRTPVEADLNDVYVAGEGGLMGLVVDPKFEQTREFTLCHAYQDGANPTDVRVVTWKLAEDGASASKVRTLLTGITLNDSGRHSGCRLEYGPDGELLVGTGDSAQAPNPQDKTSLGGKVLRVDPKTGEGLPDNPFADSDNANTRRLATYGHRNVQGVALRPGTDQVFSAEHGPDVDDEVNRIELGGNYGWDPSRGGTVDDYDESVSMTDTQRFPDAVRPLWTTGEDTEALCGAEFLDGEQWGELDGVLAVTALKAQKLFLLRLDDAGEKVESVTVPEELDGTHGRLRAARLGPDGALYVSTDDGEDDEILRVTAG
ncbi:MAG: PQQ-dependent sugar dehydrogenase [Thermocrispum sp.]